MIKQLLFLVFASGIFLGTNVAYNAEQVAVYGKAGFNGATRLNAQGGGCGTQGTGILINSCVVSVDGAALRTYVAATTGLSLSFGTIGAAASAGVPTCASQTMTIAGAVIGDKITIGYPSLLLTYPSLSEKHAVTLGNTLTIQLCNNNIAGSVTPSTLTFGVDIVKAFP